MQPKVKQYGDISSVEVCKESKRTDCDYIVITNFKIYGKLPPNVISGMVPVFFKSNTIIIKDGKIISVKGDGKKPR